MTNNMGMFVLRMVVMSGLMSGLYAEPPRSIEVFGSAGIVKFGQDEGWGGSGAVYGGSVMLPILPKLAIDMDVVTTTDDSGRETVQSDFSQRRTLVSPSLLYRFGTERAYGFVGGGAGAVFERSRAITPLYSYDQSETFWSVHWRGGAVAALGTRLLIRAEVFSVHHYLLPTIGVRAGAGVRF
ncbi:MAG: hypothetical protein HUU41_14815 [Bryobacteraceae bacterium]|nr:hypothetical protein [Bryobacterales bacterium]MEB2360609.1 hypothetical protein [Bryobacterales bacterium]NUN02383.1 hypothetical protein [Bryobacteraceae bacterium]